MTLDLSTLYAVTGTAKLADLPAYEDEVKRADPRDADATLTSPVLIFDHNSH